MQMELHPLLRRVVLLGLLFALHDGVGLQHHVAGKAVDVQLSLNQKMLALFDPIHNGLALIPREEFTDPDGSGVVGDVEGDHPGPPLFQFPVVDEEDVPLHHHRPHIQVQGAHGYRLFFDLVLSVDHPAVSAAPLLRL